MSDEKAIVVIRAKDRVSKKRMQEFTKLYNIDKSVEQGILMLPNDFEFVLLDPKTFKPIELDWQEVKRETFWSRLKRRFKKCR